MDRDTQVTTVSAPPVVPSLPATKRALLVLCHAMERAFDLPEVGDCEPGVVLGLFQRREFFDVEAARYGALAAAGHIVIAGFAGSVAGVPEGVHAVTFAADDPRAREWVVALVRGPFATALVARDSHRLSPGELSVQAGRLFDATWTFRRQPAVQAARVELDRVADGLPPRVVQEARQLLTASAGLPTTAVEERLAAAAEHLVTSMDAGDRRATRLRVELEATQAQAERDQLTGLNNRFFLERYLVGDDRAVDLLTLLVDVDNLKAANDRHGHGAGDAVLRAVAGALLTHSRPGDVTVRWGGDEFLMLVPGLDAAAGLRFAERLAQAVRETRPAPPWSELSTSVSIGVCATARATLPMDQLDAALYEVKRGRKGHAALPPARRSGAATR